MSRWPVLSGRKIIRALGKLGYREVSQTGSHIRLRCEGRRSVTVPNYPVSFVEANINISKTKEIILALKLEILILTRYTQ